MAKVWVVAANCGDYYCGCGQGHLLGVYTSEEKAVEARDAANVAEHFHSRIGGLPTSKTYKPRKSWEDVWLVEGETDGAPTPPMTDGNSPEWGVIVETTTGRSS